MTTVVVSQPMFLPWIGIFEQIAIADVFVHYDDVQFPQGRSFTNRVQISTRAGTAWLTAPVDHDRSGRLISQTRLVAAEYWRPRHLETIRHAYGKSPHFPAMFDLVREIYAFQGDNLADFNISAINRVAERMGILPRVEVSTALGIAGRSTGRLVDICLSLNASRYVTGHGAIGYLDHKAFESRGIAVDYMAYAHHPWPQIGPEFTPFVTILDLLAAVPFDEARSHLASSTQSWRTFKQSREGL